MLIAGIVICRYNQFPLCYLLHNLDNSFADIIQDMILIQDAIVVNHATRVEIIIGRTSHWSCSLKRDVLKSFANFKF